MPTGELHSCDRDRHNSSKYLLCGSLQNVCQILICNKDTSMSTGGRAQTDEYFIEVNSQATQMIMPTLSYVPIFLPMATDLALYLCTPSTIYSMLLSLLFCISLSIPTVNACSLSMHSEVWCLCSSILVLHFHIYFLGHWVGCPLCFSRLHHFLMSYTDYFHSFTYLLDPWKYLVCAPVLWQGLSYRLKPPTYVFWKLIHPYTGSWSTAQFHREPTNCSNWFSRKMFYHPWENLEYQSQGKLNREEFYRKEQAQDSGSSLIFHFTTNLPGTLGQGFLNPYGNYFVKFSFFNRNT